MRVEIAKNAYLSKTRQNSTQTCSACGKKLPMGTPAISLRKPFQSQGVNVWIHPKCARPYFNKILSNINEKLDEIVGGLI